jgi:CHAT domain-containing protein/tetratricopeptide (TPR) repeat protein
MRRILALGVAVIASIFLMVVAPWQAMAQEGPAAPAGTAAKVEPGRLGAQLRDLSEQSAKALGLGQAHAILVELPYPSSPAERAGLRPGDVILELDGAPVGPLGELIPALQRIGAGNAATLGLLRGSERMTVKAMLVRAADIPPAPDLTERKIEASEAILRIFNQEAFPRDWAATQNNLGAAHERAGNLDKAIAAFGAALTVFTREALPHEWALTQNNLGIVYLDRIRGERADNLDEAIGAFQAALTVFTREALPHEWAETQNNLGIAYQDRIRGERADSQEKAIAAYEAALTVRTREALPRDWAETQSNLGIVFEDRIRGERADNLDKAIAAFEAALTVRTREALPREWAATQNNLGGAYWNRIRGERADNLEKAIAAYEAALTVRTREATPREWATTQINLGVAYHDRIRGERAHNLEKAIAAYEAALTVITREALPREWALTQNNLGTVYEDRIGGERADNLEKAIAAYEAALTMRSREALPRESAQTRSNLGDAYADRIRGERGDNLEKAIAAYEDALTVYTRTALPRDHLFTGRLLGRVLAETHAWRKAGLAYAGARDAFLLLFGQGLNEAEARDLIGEAGPLFAEAAFAAVQLGDGERALALATEGRARMMAVALKLQTLDLPADKRRRLEELRPEIRAAERAAEAAQGAERAAAVETLGGLRQELLGLVNAAGRTAHASALAEARALAGKSGAVVVPVVTRFGAKILVVRGSDPQGLTQVDLPKLTTEKLDALVRGDGKSGGWLAAYKINYIEDEAERARRWPEWIAAVGGLGPELWRLVGGRLDAALQEAGVKPGARIVWMPTGALGILPLGLAQDPKSGRRLADNYEIVYAPSLEALIGARKRIAKAAPRATLGLVVNPTRDLPGTEKEGRLVASYFPAAARAVRERDEASPEEVLAMLKGRSYWHFASHGTFSWGDARKSGLYMAGPAVLTVGRLLDTDGLGRPRLVVLSACETGLYDIRSNPDEFIGLPGTFTALGAAGVLGTLWPVDDAATSLLMSKFYELHLGSRLAPPTALRRAQTWLREATNADLQAYARGATWQGRLETRHLSELEADLSDDGLKRSRNAAAIQWQPPSEPVASGRGASVKTPTAASARRMRPYAHPYFWAGFIYTGL